MAFFCFTKYLSHQQHFYINCVPFSLLQYQWCLFYITCNMALKYWYAFPQQLNILLFALNWSRAVNVSLSQEHTPLCFFFNSRANIVFVCLCIWLSFPFSRGGSLDLGRIWAGHKQLKCGKLRLHLEEKCGTVKRKKKKPTKRRKKRISNTYGLRFKYL